MCIRDRSSSSDSDDDEDDEDEKKLESSSDDVPISQLANQKPKPAAKTKPAAKETTKETAPAKAPEPAAEKPAEPAKTKRAPSAYILFCNEERAKLPDTLGPKEKMTELGVRWKALDAKKKAKFEGMAKDGKEAKEAEAAKANAAAAKEASKQQPQKQQRQKRQQKHAGWPYLLLSILALLRAAAELGRPVGIGLGRCRRCSQGLHGRQCHLRRDLVAVHRSECGTGSGGFFLRCSAYCHRRRR